MSLDAELSALDAMDLEDLAKVWRPAFGTRPGTRSVGLMRRLIAWELQAAAFGGLDRATRDALRRSQPVGSRAKPPIGSRLSREWKGVRHEVEVVAEGYRHEGQTYRSLSTVASRITGARWNGWRFFGLGEAPTR
jgi:hypothetical protein